MSIDALSWAFNLDLPNSGVKLTLLALANYANEENRTAYPSQKTISQKTCLSTRAIRNHLVVLEKLGVIFRQPRKREDGTFTSDLFTLNVGFSPPKTIGRNYQRQNLPTAKNDSIQRQNLPSPAAKSARHEPNLTSTKAKGEPHTYEGEFLDPENPAETPETACVVPPKTGRAGSCCQAMIANGIQGCNPHHPTLLELLKADATEDEFAYAARDAIARGNPKFAYVIGIVKRQREEAAKLVLHQGRLPSKQEIIEAQNRAVAAAWMPPEMRRMKNAN